MDSSLEFAGENRPQLEEVLNHYAKSPERLNSATNIIRNLPHWYAYEESADLDSIEHMLHIIATNKDIWYFAGLSSRDWKSYDYHNLPKVYDSHVITADYLIRNIDEAHHLRESKKWNRDIPEDVFLNFLLPYRIGDERISDWRKLYSSKYSMVIDSICPDTDDSLVAAQAVWSELSKEGYKYNVCSAWPHRRAIDLFATHAGPCRDQTDHYVYALRSVGIPCAIDTYFISPELNTSHRWVMVYDNKTGRWIPFEKDMVAKRNNPINDPRKKGKVYRLVQSLQEDRIDLINPVKDISSPVRDYYIRDVSEEYFGDNSLTFSINNPEKKQVMLGIFSPDGWKVIDYATESGKDRAVFKHIEPRNLYIPLISGDNPNQVLPCGMPLIYHKDLSTEILMPGKQMETVTLERKMPFTYWLNDWFSRGVGGGKFALASNSSFTNASVSLPLPDTLATNRHVLYFPPTQTEFVRYSVPGKNEIVIGEIEIYADSACTHILPYTVITEFDKYHDAGKIHDGNILSFFALPDTMRNITMRLLKPQKVEAIAFIPRNNDNFVWKGDLYSLLYFDSPEKGWVECSSQMADGWTLNMTAPEGALLWLRDLTKGYEEQAFIWRNRHQYFTYDIDREDE